jgi:predicted histidine transporter YuiF (NhaC family)
VKGKMFKLLAELIFIALIIGEMYIIVDYRRKRHFNKNEDSNEMLDQMDEKKKMKNIDYVLIIIFIALPLYSIIGGISVGDYENLATALVVFPEFILWELLDKKLLTQLRETSKKPNQIIGSVLMLSTFLLLVMFVFEYVFVRSLRDGFANGIMNGLEGLSIYVTYKYWNLWKKRNDLNKNNEESKK